MTSQKIDDWGRIILDEQGILEMFYKGHFETADVLSEQSELIENYNKWCVTFDAPEKQIAAATPLQESPEEFHRKRQSQWIMADEYSTIDLDVFLLERCNTEEQRRRVADELVLFRKHSMDDVLRFLIYLVDALREANVWWGVGRGSSVASYCLYLIGVHKIDSLLYDLDITEFIRD